MRPLLRRLLRRLFLIFDLLEVRLRDEFTVINAGSRVEDHAAETLDSLAIADEDPRNLLFSWNLDGMKGTHTS